MMRLPIDVIPNTNPPRFKWQRMVDTPGGKRVIDCDGCLNAGVEDAVQELIKRHRKALQHIEELEGQVVMAQKANEKPTVPAKKK